MAGPEPLNQSHCDTLTMVLQKLREAGELLSKCRDCNLDTAQMDEWRAAQEAQAAALKRTFFPHCP